MPSLPRPATLLLPLLLAGAPAAAAGLAICDASTALTPIGVDTSTGRVLLSVPPLGKGKSWIVELEAGAGRALAYPDAGGGRFGGSVGPGAVLAALPCPGSCLQPVRWSEGRWEPLGEPLSVPSVVTAGMTWDLTGAPWVVVHGKAAKSAAGQARAWAFRLEGREWVHKGSLDVAAVGDLQAVPSPQRKDGILSGTGLFAASGRPEAWVAGLPSLPAERRGQVVALGGGGAAYLSADGGIYLSTDSGKTWRRSTWTPWGAGPTGLWRQGSDFWVDLPLGDRQGNLQLAWFDRRVPSEESVALTRLTRTGDWLLLAQARSEVRTKNDRLAVSHVLAPREDAWLLLSGCAGTAEGSGLVVRTLDGGAVSAPRLVPIRAAGPTGGRKP